MRYRRLRAMAAQDHDDLFPGHSEVAALMRTKDWSQTSLGSPEHWPRSLRTIVRVLLTSRFAMWMGWGPELTFLYNDAYAAMTLGAKHPWALGRPSREVWAEIWPEIGPRIQRVLDTGEATWDEDLLLFLERSGYPEETYHTFSYSPVTDDDGTVCGHLCVVTEATDRVIGERRLALLRDTAVSIASSNTESELFTALRAALGSNPRDLPFTLTYLFDETTERASLVCRTGIAPDHPSAVPELTTGDPAAAWPLADALGAAAGLVVTVGAGVALPQPSPWDKPPTHALIVPIAQSAQKGPAGVFVAGINPYRVLDDQYRSFVALLVGQIASGIANARAYEEERRRVAALAEIDRAKTAFFSNVSHEFRTPLTLMLGPIDDGLSDMEHPLPPAQRERQELVRRNGLRLQKLVNTLLDFSRIEAGRMRARFEPLDLTVLTRDLASTFQSAMERAGLEYVVACEPLSETVYVDRDMWEKIVLNLVSNAFKFTLQGRVTVSLTADNGRARLAVEDTGAGIPADQVPHVFERFHRVEGVQGRSFEGSGIGLALVLELVKLHRGELTVESREGRGSTFAVSVPAGAEHLPAEQIVPAGGESAFRVNHAFSEEALRWLPEAPAPPDGRVRVSGESEAGVLPAAGAGHVLIADDNADMREYARRLLSERWIVTAVSNGLEAVTAARAYRPDVIVTDVMMPILDGFGLLRQLRADPELDTIPVVMLSARAGEDARLEALAASADDYLVKPFSARDLIGRVDAQLLRSRARAIERRHAQRLTTLFTQAPIATAILRGPEHVYELANAAYRAIVGGRELVGKPIREAIPEFAGQAVYELLDAVRASGEPFVDHSMRLTLNRGSGGALEDAYFDIVCQPVFDDERRVDAIVVMSHEVTTLAAAKHDAETANRLKDEFLATLSHELRTPLNAVLGYTQMLRDGVIGSERFNSVLETIERNARLQEQLISDVLDISRIITGKLRLDMRPVVLATVILDALETVAPTAAAKSVRLQPFVDAGGGVAVAGDAQRLLQVVWNLLSNAVKFTPAGGCVQVRLAAADSQAEIVVSDTGEGIASEFLPQLFQRFKQADGSFTRAHSGLGLGLAISRHLIEAHGGSIEATSPGRGLGTSVRVCLPIMVHPPALERTASRQGPPDPSIVQKDS